MSEAGDSLEIGTEVKQAVGSKDTPKTAETERTSLDAILIFGQGPVLNKESRIKADKDNTEITDETDINMWAKTLAISASELYKRGQTREFIVLGGRTGGEAYLSEADKIAEEMIKCGIPEKVIRREQGSSNTLENISNVLNEYIDSTGQYQKVGVLGSNFHIPRIKMLMQMFNIPCKEAFSAEEVMRYAARERKDSGQWDKKMLLEIERRLDMAGATKTPVSSRDKVNSYYQGKQGEENKDIARRGQEEDVWSKALLEMPEYWIGYVGRLQNRERIRQILADQDQKMLAEKFGIHMLFDTDEEIKQKLLTITRKLPNIEKEVGGDWPHETQLRLEDFIKRGQE